MKKELWIPSGIAVAAITAGLAVYSQTPARGTTEMRPAATFRILLGADRKAAVWDGRISLTPGKISEIRGWRFAGGDSTDGAAGWKVSTRHSPGRKGNVGPILENGVLVSAVSSDPAARFEVKTAQGNFSFRAQEIAYGEPKSFLNGRVSVDRVPSTSQITTSPEEQDFPAIAQSGDTVYVSYVEFTHSDRSLEVQRKLDKAPRNFDFLARPTGGDQVFLIEFSKSRRTWGTPVAVSAPKQDIMRTAVAVDGQKRTWVFWSANRAGNFDLYARYRAGGRWSPEMRLTTDEGTDLNPVAATDSGGRVWVAWQGFRKNNLEILAAVQNGDSFGRESAVSFSPASDWDPAITAASNGEVAVSWDTYDKGDYDVYFRRLRMDGTVRMDAPVPAAASRNFEGRSSVAYDARNRLWIAYEASSERWGKDFGAYETSGIALYRNQNVRVKCFEGTQALTTAADLEDVLPGPRVRRGQQSAEAGATLPDPSLAPNRAPNITPQTPPMPANSFARIAADPNGVIYLAFRTPDAGRTPMGTAWLEHMVYFDGAAWKGPLTIPDTDNFLDARVVMTAIAPGDLLVIGTSDHRQSAARPAAAGKKKGRKQAPAESIGAQINSDLIAAELNVTPAARGAQLKPVAAEPVSAPDPGAPPERQQISLMRNYRVSVGSQKLQLMRGEFHRHTEYSSDGGRDGALIDAYRYLIDAASMDWGGCCDHDNGGGREYSWWIHQKLTDAYKLGSHFVPMFAYERSVSYPEGHRNAVFARRGIRPLPRLPKTADDSPSAPAPDTQMLYAYLRQFDGIVASHTSGTNMGTDWRDNDPVLEPVVEIYQGDRQNYEMPDAPRSNNAKDSLGGWRPLGFVSLALKKGYRLGFEASSDHASTHMSYCNLWVTEPTRQGIMEAFHKRRVYGSTDNILADVHCGSHFMGEEFTTAEPPSISVRLEGTANFAKVHVIRDSEYVYTIQPGTRKVEFSWRDNAAQKGKTSYYYVRGEQADGELVWVSPMWITYR